MVVVDNARKMIGKTIDVVVTSVLQTTAGKMIFGRFIEPGRSRHSVGTVGARGAGRPDAASARPQSAVPRLRAELASELTSSVSLVADGLLPDPVPSPSTRSCSARCRSRRVFFERGYFAHWCARTWSRLILATTGVRVDVAASSGSSPDARTSSSRTIRASTTFRSCSGRCRTSCESSRRSRSANFRSSAGTCGAPATCSSIASSPIAPGSSRGRRG